MPYKPASAYDTRMPAQTNSTGQAVDFIEMPMPAMMLVACPVVDACAMCFTGWKSVPV